MPGFDKMGAYQTVDSTDREDESNSQCQSQLDDTNNVQGMFFRIIIFKFFLYWYMVYNSLFNFEMFVKITSFCVFSRLSVSDKIFKTPASCLLFSYVCLVIKCFTQAHHQEGWA